MQKTLMELLWVEQYMKKIKVNEAIKFWEADAKNKNHSLSGC